MSEEIVPVDLASIDALAPADQANNIWSFLPPTGRISSSFDRQNEGHRAVMMKCLDNPDFKSNDAIGKTIRIVHILTQGRQVVRKEGGEVIDFPYVCLIDDMTNVYAFGSLGILGSIRNLMGVFGPPPWTPPLTVRVAQVATGDGRRTFKLIYEGSTDVEAPPASGDSRPRPRRS